MTSRGGKRVFTRNEVGQLVESLLRELSDNLPFGFYLVGRLTKTATLPLGSLNIGLLVCTGYLAGPLLSFFSLLRTSEVALNIGAVFLCDFLCLGLTFLLSSGGSGTLGIFLTLALVFYSGETEVFRSLNKLGVLVSLNLLLAGLLL